MLQRKIVIILAAALSGATLSAFAQDDSPPLGDLARQSRQQHQQKDSQPKPDARTNTNDTHSNKDAQSSTPTAKKVITNDEIPSHVGPTATYQPSQPRTWASPGNDRQDASAKPSAEALTAQFRARKESIASLEDVIAHASESIQYASGNCVTNCVLWNEQQKRKQQEVDSLKSQLEQGRQQLEQMQEAARKQGYGSAIYDP
ncbi:MAG: hypothetical protein WAN03_11360 [Candidatus Sulfotelmatobacter sp.]